jgi:prevent-host-death family protein
MYMNVERLGVSEARQRLPEIVRRIARDGGRIDVTVRGRPRVSIVRTDILERRTGRGEAVPAALELRLNVPPGTLVDVIRDLRSSVGGARPLPAGRAVRRRRTTR